jgi:hypothetical protein
MISIFIFCKKSLFSCIILCFFNRRSAYNSRTARLITLKLSESYTNVIGIILKQSLSAKSNFDTLASGHFLRRPLVGHDLFYSLFNANHDKLSPESFRQCVSEIQPVESRKSRTLIQWPEATFSDLDMSSVTSLIVF